MVLVRLLFFWVCSICLLGLLSVVQARELPIYIENSHAGSFGFFAQELDLDSDYTLVLLDAHSDASGVPESDRIRTGLRKVVSKDQRVSRITGWRKSGAIQPFNWIEPLMPHPISKVIWIAGESLSDDALKKLQHEAGIHLDWQTQVVARHCGELKNRYIVTDWNRFKRMKLSEKVVVSVDLDYYGQESVSESHFETHWKYFLNLPTLEALSIAVSRPWLKDEAQGFRFLERAMSAAFNVRNATVRFEPFLNDWQDRSEKAKIYRMRGEQVPRMDLSRAPVSFKNLLLRQSGRLDVRYEKQRWLESLERWRADRSGWVLEVSGRQKSIDGVWRMPIQEVEDLVVLGDGELHRHQKVRWWMLVPEQSIYNLDPEFMGGKAFADRVGRYVQSQKRRLAETDDLALAARQWVESLPWAGESGVLRIQAEIVGEHGSEWTPVIEIRVRNRSGFRGELSEQFGLPYVFGIGRLKDHGESGPETMIGNDCANFMVYAMRRMGRRIPWCNPKQLREYLHAEGGVYQLGEVVPIRDGMIERGAILHLGSHVAAVWEDKGDIGVLDADDLVVHHLSDVPEIITFKTLMKNRTSYELYTLPSYHADAMLVFGGDVNLAGVTSDTKVFSKQIRKVLEQADFSLINLECALVPDRRGRLKKVRGRDSVPKRFQFLADPSALDHLLKAGVDAVSLANNHSMDAGVLGLAETINSLKGRQFDYLGAGENLEKSARPLLVRIQEIDVALIAVNTIEVDASLSGSTRAGVFSYPAHQNELVNAIREAHRAADIVIVLPHWGDEYTARVSDSQRSMAKWLIQQGADAIVGSHSHHPQALDFYRGCPVVFSLGNLYFPTRGPREFNRYQLLKFPLDRAHGIDAGGIEWNQEALKHKNRIDQE